MDFFLNKHTHAVLGGATLTVKGRRNGSTGLLYNYFLAKFNCFGKLTRSAFPNLIITHQRVTHTVGSAYGCSCCVKIVVPFCAQGAIICRAVTFFTVYIPSIGHFGGQNNFEGITYMHGVLAEYRCETQFPRFGLRLAVVLEKEK